MSEPRLFTTRLIDLDKIGRSRPPASPDDVTVYRRHNCDAKHLSAKTFLKCAIPRAAWVYGVGEYATVAWCNTPTVEIHRTLEQAVKAKRMIDSTGCGGGCHRRHQIIRVELPR